ncbi:unnamed protein product, partial [Iphiclides podalirius]
MANTQFALTSKLHEKYICSGLSNLQQNGELVDMTLAADGHLVKVHQVILALASPYIKDLISSAQCQHPVIFLNKISYTTLSAMLEYIYTGEVLVTVENLGELVEAGKELHIKGLEDMHLHTELVSKTYSPQSTEDDAKKTLDGELFLEMTNRESDNLAEETVYDDKHMTNIETTEARGQQETHSYEDPMEEESEGPIECIKEEDTLDEHLSESLQRVGASKVKLSTADKKNAEGTLQYTVSNQGSLQMILNRYMYYLKYTNRNRSKQWRCVDYLKSARCPAHVVTRDDVVIQRTAAHTHPFHDQRILKKVRAGAVFSAIVEAEKEGENIIKGRGAESGVQSE